MPDSLPTRGPRAEPRNRAGTLRPDYRRERGGIAVAATTCGLFVAFSTLKLVEAFGGGRHGFFITACLYGALATIVLLIVFATAREAEDDDDAHAATLAQMWQAVRVNRPFWIVSAAMLASIFGSTLFGKTLPYHFKYALERPDLIGLALTVMTGAVALSMPVWTLVMWRTSKRVTWMAGVAVGLTGYTTFVLAGSVIGGLLAALALIGAGAGAAYLGFWSMMPDTVEYGEWKTGIRSEGGVFGIVSLIQKAGFGIAAALLGEALGAIGYRAGATQTAATLESMRWLMLGGGSTMALIGAALISMYPIDRNRHARLLDEIAARAKS